MDKRHKIITALVIVLVLTLAITIMAMAASKTKCSTIYKGIDGKVAKLCYTMNATWWVSQEAVTCNGEGTVYAYIYKSGYSWSGVGRSCNPNYYASHASGIGYGTLRGPFGSSNHSAWCNVFGDQVNTWYCGKK